MKKRYYLLLLILGALLPGLLSAQNVAIEGTVTDENGNPLAGAVVVRKGTSLGGVTDENGRFSLNASAGSTLTVTYLGYLTKDVEFTGQSPLSITLVSETQTLDEVVVVGYGTQRVRDLTAPIATVSGSELAKQTAANPMSALQGKVAGVQITNSGAPGAGPAVRIRGTGSIGDYTNPL